MSLIPSRMKKKGKFTFDKRWCNKPEMMEVVRRGWNADTGGNRGSVSQRIQSCRKELSTWKKSSASNSSGQIMRLREMLETEGKKQFPYLQLLSSTRIELEKAYQEEEAFWKLKSKNTWLQVGDKKYKSISRLGGNEEDEEQSTIVG